MSSKISKNKEDTVSSPTLCQKPLDNHPVQNIGEPAQCANISKRGRQFLDKKLKESSTSLDKEGEDKHIVQLLKKSNLNNTLKPSLRVKSIILQLLLLKRSINIKIESEIKRKHVYEDLQTNDNLQSPPGCNEKTILRRNPVASKFDCDYSHN